MPHSHTLAARVSMAWTISTSLCLHVCVAACAVGPHTDCCCCGYIPVKSTIVTWHHNKNYHVYTCCSHCCELIDTHALSMHRSTVVARRQCSLPAYHYYYFFFALVLHSQGLKISKCRTVCPEWLWWGLGNCERVGKADCVETLNCHRNALVQKRSFPRIGCAECGSSADFCEEAVGLIR